MKTLKPLTATVAFVFLLLVSTSYSQTGNTVKIGKQEWTAENLNVSTFRNGDPIPEIKSNEEWEKAGKEGKPAWCYYKNNPENGKKYGKLYNWNAVNDARGLAPKGWHIPTDREWQILVDHQGGTRQVGKSSEQSPFEAAGKLKETGTSHWQSPNTGATNESGFSALPGGNRSYEAYGDHLHMGIAAHFWSSSESGSPTAWSRTLYYNDSRVLRSPYAKTYGFSVRCVRD